MTGTAKEQPCHNEFAHYISRCRKWCPTPPPMAYGNLQGIYWTQPAAMAVAPPTTLALCMATYAINIGHTHYSRFTVLSRTTSHRTWPDRLLRSGLVAGGSVAAADLCFLPLGAADRSFLDLVCLGGCDAVFFLRGSAERCCLAGTAAFFFSGGPATFFCLVGIEPFVLGGPSRCCFLGSALFFLAGSSSSSSSSSGSCAFGSTFSPSSHPYMLPAVVKLLSLNMHMIMLTFSRAQGLGHSIRCMAVTKKAGINSHVLQR